MLGRARTRPITRTRERSELATVEECETALQSLAAMLAEKNAAREAIPFDRTLSCTVRDLSVTFAGHLHGGRLDEIAQLPAGTKPTAQVRLELTSDDLVSLVSGELNLASAWASRRLKIQAGVLDMIRLKAIF